MPITRASPSGGLIPWRSPRTQGTIVPFTRPARYTVSGVTRTSTGAVLANCTVTLYETESGAVRASTISDANGDYAFDVTGNGVDEYGAALTFSVRAYLAGAPDVAGTTVNTLVGAEQS